MASFNFSFFLGNVSDFIFKFVRYKMKKKIISGNQQCIGAKTMILGELSLY